MTRFILVNRYFYPDECATAQFATDLAQHLEHRYEVIALTSRQKLEEPDARLPAQGALGAVRIVRLWSTRFGRPRLTGRALDYLSFLCAVGLWLLFKTRRGDIIVAKTDPPLLGVVTTLATLGRGVQRVQWLQDLYPETAVALGVTSESGLLTRLTRALRNWSLRNSHLIVAVSSGMLEHLRGIPADAKMVHIPNWSDDFGAGEAVIPSEAKDLLVGYSGNLGRAHPVDALLQLAEGAPEPGVRFVISGGGAHYERLRSRLAELGRSNWAFLPYQPRERLAGLLRTPSLHLVILDPRVERHIFPSKVFGILAAGRPILHLGRPDGEVATLLRERGCGWSIPADSGEALRAKLRELRAAPALLEQAGLRAREAYETQFSKAHALDRWDQSLDRLARESGHPLV